MTDLERKIIEKAGLNPADFNPKPDDDKDRLNDIEDALIELAEIISEVSSNG